jgi:hypothetical protein
MIEIPEIVQRFRHMLDTSSEEELEALAYNSPAVRFALCLEIKEKNAKWIRPEPNVLQFLIERSKYDC